MKKKEKNKLNNISSNGLKITNGIIISKSVTRIDPSITWLIFELFTEMLI